MFERRKNRLTKPHLWLIALIGVIVPRRLRADWRQEWEAELHYRETLLAEWDKLDWRSKFDLLWHSLGAFMDALWLQPRSFGLAPAWKASRSHPNEALKEGGRSSSGGLRLRQARGFLVVVECALAVTLLASAGLMIRSFMRLQSVDPGFKPEGVLLTRVSLPRSTNRTKAQTAAFFQQVIDRVAALPGVHAAGAIEDFIMRRNPDNAITVEGRAPDDAGRGAGELIAERISHDLFQALAMPLLKGRFFTRQETIDSHLVIVNETLARRCFPGEDPIGKRFKFGGPQSENNWFEIVGVVGDLRRQRLEKQDVSEVYAPGVSNNMDLLVRVSGDPLTLVGAVRREIRSDDTTVVWSERDRSGGLRWRGRAAGGGRVIGVLFAGPQSDEGGPGDCAEERIKRHMAYEIWNNNGQSPL